MQHMHFALHVAYCGAILLAIRALSGKTHHLLHEAAKYSQVIIDTCSCSKACRNIYIKKIAVLQLEEIQCRRIHTNMMTHASIVVFGQSQRGLITKKIVADINRRWLTNLN
jgi:hypothetical protein